MGVWLTVLDDVALVDDDVLAGTKCEPSADVNNNLYL
jgi:hypothetical protein